MPGPDQHNPSAPAEFRMPEASLSRRELFPSVIGGVAIIAAALSLGREAEAQPKTSQKAAKYQNHPKKGQQCAICRYFRPPHACQLVEGNISPNGWCSYFAKKTG